METTPHAADAPETGAEAATEKQAQATPQRAELGYRPDGMTMWNPWFVEHDGLVHMFHLQRLSGDSTHTGGVAAGLVVRADRQSPHAAGDFVIGPDANDRYAFGVPLTMFFPMTRRTFPVELGSASCS